MGVLFGLCSKVSFERNKNGHIGGTATCKSASRFIVLKCRLVKLNTSDFLPVMGLN